MRSKADRPPRSSPSARPDVNAPQAAALHDLPSAFRAKACEWRAFAAESQAATLDWAAEQVENSLARREDEVLTLSEAAAEMGRSRDHVGRLVRKGTLPNAGRMGAPRVRRGDLEARRIRPVAASEASDYDVNADVRSLLARRGG